MKPTTLLPAIALASLITVEFGGWSLLGFLTGSGRLDEFQERYFRAGHAHAGVLLVLALAALPYLDRGGFAPRTQWLAGGLLLAGILAQSGGFFLHLWLGEAGHGSPGTVVTRAGAVAIAGALGTVAVGLLKGK